MVPTVPKPFSLSNKPLISPRGMTLYQEHLLVMKSYAKMQWMRGRNVCLSQYVGAFVQNEEIKTLSGNDVSLLVKYCVCVCQERGKKKKSAAYGCVFACLFHYALCISPCVCISMCVFMCICVCVCVCVCMCVCLKYGGVAV